MLTINVMTKRLRSVLRCRRWRDNPTNHVQSKQYFTAWYAANLESVKVNNATWRAANLERRRTTNAAWRAANYERQQQRIAAWKLANPERVKANAIKGTRKRKARKLGRVIHFTPAEFRELKHQLGDCCICCHRHESELTSLGLKIVPDHVVPLAKGGSDDIENIQPLCSNGVGACNQRKGATFANYMIRV